MTGKALGTGGTVVFDASWILADGRQGHVNGIEVLNPRELGSSGGDTAATTERGDPAIEREIVTPAIAEGLRRALPPEFGDRASDLVRLWADLDALARRRPVDLGAVSLSAASEGAVVQGKLYGPHQRPRPAERTRTHLWWVLESGPSGSVRLKQQLHDGWGELLRALPQAHAADLTRWLTALRDEASKEFPWLAGRMLYVRLAGVTVSVVTCRANLWSRR